MGASSGPKGRLRRDRQILSWVLGLGLGGVTFTLTARFEGLYWWIWATVGRLVLLGICVIIVLGVVRWRDEGFRRFAIETVLIAVLCTAIGSILMPVSSGRGSGLRTHQLSVCKQLARAIEMYVSDHDGHGPPADWARSVSKYGPPIEYPKEGISFAFNARLIGRDFSKLEEPANTVLLFESRLPAGSVGTFLDASVPQGVERVALAFGDFHVKRVARNEMLELRWAPIFGAKRRE